jgi:hypothetical protein
MFDYTAFTRFRPGGLLRDSNKCMESKIMKTLISAVAVAVAVLAAPTVSFAQQSNAPVTRAEVRAQLVELEKAGYQPNDWVDYPQNIQAAEQRVQAEHATGYGSTTNGSAQSGN